MRAFSVWRNTARALTPNLRRGGSHIRGGRHARSTEPETAHEDHTVDTVDGHLARRRSAMPARTRTPQPMRTTGTIQRLEAKLRSR